MTCVFLHAQHSQGAQIQPNSKHAAILRNISETNHTNFIKAALSLTGKPIASIKSVKQDVVLFTALS